MNAALSIARRELVDFFRARARVISAILTPILFWALLGLGMGRSFQLPGSGAMDYERYFFPGIVMLSIVFAGIFSTISTIQDRNSGFLQAVLVAPVPRWSIGLGKMLGATTIALFQGLVILPLAWLAGVETTLPALLASVGVLALVAFMMSGMGFYFAWRFDSVQGFHSVMNIVLFPMWLLSGAMFPASGAALPVAWAMQLNPLTYGAAAFRRVLEPGLPHGDLPGLPLCLGVCLGFGLLMLTLAARSIGRREG